MPVQPISFDDLEQMWNSCFPTKQPEFAYLPLSNVIELSEKMDDCREDVLEFIQKCASAGVSLGATVLITPDSISLCR